jgi:hypothetical protein
LLGGDDWRLAKDGQDKMVEVLRKQKETGFARTQSGAGMKGWPSVRLYYAHQTQKDGKRIVVVLTERNMTMAERTSGGRSVDYDVSAVVMELEPVPGDEKLIEKGQGTLFRAAKLEFDRQQTQRRYWGRSHPFTDTTRKRCRLATLLLRAVSGSRRISGTNLTSVRELIPSYMFWPSDPDFARERAFQGDFQLSRQERRHRAVATGRPCRRAHHELRLPEVGQTAEDTMKITPISRPCLLASRSPRSAPHPVEPTDRVAFSTQA